jgi:hypothetical protein
MAPYGIEDQVQFIEDCMRSLKQSSPSKCKVAQLLYGAIDNKDPVSDRTASGATGEADGTTSGATEKDPLLAQCFGNRSAVLYSMKKYNVRFRRAHQNT